MAELRLAIKSNISWPIWVQLRLLNVWKCNYPGSTQNGLLAQKGRSEGSTMTALKQVTDFRKYDCFHNCQFFCVSVSKASNWSNKIIPLNTPKNSPCVSLVLSSWHGFWIFSCPLRFRSVYSDSWSLLNFQSTNWNPKIWRFFKQHILLWRCLTINVKLTR